MKTYKQFSYLNRTAVVRIDLDVPVKNGRVTDDTRLRASLPTIEYIRQKGGKVVIIGHMGRPKGRIVPELSVSPVVTRLKRMLGEKVELLSDIQTPQADIAVLENLRFWPGEESNDSDFAKSLAGLGDIYIDDAFANSHRVHASMDAITRYLPSGAGDSFLNEVKYLKKVTRTPTHPYIAIVGAAKVSDKIKILTSLLEKVDKLILGGAVVFTFMKALGHETGRSLVEEDMVSVAKSLLQKHKAKIILPVDFIAADDMDFPVIIKKVGTDIPLNLMGLDIGRKSIELFKLELKYARTIIWNGPLGRFENPQFAKGTREIAKYLAQSKAKTIIGGGDTGAALRRMKLSNKMTHVSIAGGAFLKYLEGHDLPAIKALEH